MLIKLKPLIVLLLLFSFSCKTAKKNENAEINIICTTGMLGDACKVIVGDLANVISLMGPGVDPHLYKATQGDLGLLLDADVIVYNGLHLEGKMNDVFEKLSKQKSIIAASNGIPKNLLINNTNFAGAHDPHIWFDVKLWKLAVKFIAQELSKQYPDLADVFSKNAEVYIQQLEQLDQETKDKIASIDSSKRVLITAHDAFAYFGKAYSIEVRGLQGISTVSEYGLKDISDLVNFIIERKIQAVFVESSVSERSLKAVVEGCTAKGHQIKIGGTLYSDAMGDSKGTEGNYIGMFKYNVNTIVESLK